MTGNENTKEEATDAMPLLQLLADAAEKTESLGAYITAGIVGGMASFAGILRYVPKRHQNGKGERLATKEDLLAQREDFEELKKYSHAFVHYCRDTFMQTTTVEIALLKQNSHNLQLRLDDSLEYAKSNLVLAQKFDEMQKESSAANNRIAQLLEAALRRTYGQQS